MTPDPQIIVKSLSPKLATKAFQAFDRATTVVVGACWAGAILMMVFAIYTITLSISARHAAETALATEPNLPIVTHKNIDSRTAQLLVDRLQRDYPGITFSLQNNQVLTVIAVEGSKFREWLTALSYIDTVSPEYHWTIQQFCVGKCHGNELMRATLAGEKISLEAPQVK